MRYTQAESSEQMPLLVAEQSSKPKKAGVPIYRVVLVKEGKLPTYESRIRSSANAYNVLREYLADTDREVFCVLCLDRKNGVIGLNTVSVGSLSASVVHPRECFKPAILSNASSVILSHNHCKQGSCWELRYSIILLWGMGDISVLPMRDYWKGAERSSWGRRLQVALSTWQERACVKACKTG